MKSILFVFSTALITTLAASLDAQAQQQENICNSTNGGCLIGVSGSTGNQATGVIGEASGNALFGVQGQGDSANSIGVYGSAGGNTTPVATGVGVYGTSGSGAGVYGNSTSGTGVEATSTTGDGVLGATQDAGHAAVSALNYATSGNAIGVYGYTANRSSGYGVYCDGNLAVTGVPKANQSTFSSLSDARLKMNVKPLSGALERLLQLRGMTYEWKEPAEHGNQIGIQSGFIAQDVEKVLPGWVVADPDGMKRISIPGRALEAMVVESIRTVKAENDALKDRVKALEANRRPLNASILGEGGFGLAVVAAAFVLSRRKRSAAGAQS